MTAADLPHQVRELENIWIQLADGARLAARVWLPADAWQAPAPAILEYLPYRKSDGTALADAGRHPYFAAHGYSWGGFNGLQVAARRPPQLKAVITVASTDDRYLDDCHYMGGCLLGSDMLKWASTMLACALQPPDPRFVGESWRRMWLDRLEQAPDLARDWVSHQLRDDFWRQGSIAEDYRAIECPVMVVGGWADAYTNAVPRLLENLAVPRLGIIGPWGHMMPHEGVPGPAIDFLREAVRWWDQWLKGIDTGIMAEPRLRAWIQDYVVPDGFHATRPGRWFAAASWPRELVTASLCVLGPDGALAIHTGRGAPCSQAVLAPTTLPHGEQGGVRQAMILGRQECGECAGVWCANGFPDEIAGDQSADDLRSLCFTTPPLDAALDILGYPRVRLRLKVDRPLALVSVRVEDVAPDGASLLVSWCEFNLTHREGHERASPLEPGREYDVEVESRVCGHRFSSGHRIRLALSPTYWPHAWPSPERVALTVVVDGASVLELPVCECGAAGSTSELDGLPTGCAGRYGDFPFGSVVSPQASTQGTRDLRKRIVEVDERSGRHLITDHEEHSRVIPSTGALYCETATDLYSIVEDDPLSATVRCTRETRSEGGRTLWRVTLASEMTCDERHFHIREEYSAYEGDDLLFTKSRSSEIGRQSV